MEILFAHFVTMIISWIVLFLSLPSIREHAEDEYITRSYRKQHFKDCVTVWLVLSVIPFVNMLHLGERAFSAIAKYITEKYYD